ncbi:TolC family protein [Deinococcus cellulosilyticus]|uniref:Transporter n=1 Tax=Deinococcus cellulosilyticus (strain DSM 18568 / NBRC 106333 / KACC 11606 / 5516J-15) TaxID=1223518 RepID=A0A511MVV2_DEIC1|nr:TolC family protein [Deinococcus cellulosilyticus]GEM44531.1 transporter [Deinococcus cellulosilyticus NBRC 106333 = KACC 11606]
MRKSIVVMALLASGLAAAQTNTTVTFQNVLKLALDRGTDVANQKTALATAQTDLKAKTEDPSTLILPLTQAQQSVKLETLKLDFVKLQVAQNVLNAYLNVLEAQENLNVLKAQLDLDQMNLDIAKAKLATKNATQLDVSKAQNTFNSSQQDHKNAQANFPVLKEKLDAFTGGALANTFTVSEPQLKVTSYTLSDLLKNAESKLPTLLQNNHSVTIAQMNVQFSDNDYTPRSTLDSAKATLETSQRALASQRTSTQSSIKDAYQNVSSTQERIKVSQEDLNNAQATLKQDQARYKNGTIARYQLRQSEVAALKAEQTYLQARDSYLKAVAALAVASGTDTLNTLGGPQ